MGNHESVILRFMVSFDTIQHRTRNMRHRIMVYLRQDWEHKSIFPSYDIPSSQKCVHLERIANDIQTLHMYFLSRRINVTTISRGVIVWSTEWHAVYSAD